MPRARKYRLVCSGRQRRARIEIGERLIPGERVFRASVEVEGRVGSRKAGLIAKLSKSGELRREYFQLRKLKKLGCDVIPTFYLADSPKGKVLLKTDLTFNGKNVVFDLATVMNSGISPWRRRQLTERERQRFDKFFERASKGQVVKWLANRQEILEKLLGNQKIALENGLFITYDAWQLSVDPKTLRGTLYITEEGFQRVGKHERKKLLRDFKANLVYYW